MTDEQKRLMKHGALLCQFISQAQMNIITDAAFGEEGKFFIDKVEEYATRIEQMPKTYEQDGKGDEAIAYLHYFIGGCDWYITEKDMGDKADGSEKNPPQEQAFGMCRLNPADDFELGYISILEITRYGAELDLHFTPTTLGAIRNEKEGRGEVIVMTRDGDEPQPLDAATLEQIAVAFSNNERN